MNRNEKALSEKRKAKRINSEPDALLAIRSKERMVASLSEESAAESQNMGIMTRIKGLRSEIYKRVSRVMSDEEIREFPQRLSNIQEPAMHQDENEASDPNMREPASEKSLHDVYRQLQLRRITTSPDTQTKGLKYSEVETGEMLPHHEPKVKVVAMKIEDKTKTDESDSEVHRVLQDLKAGKSSRDIACSRNIIQKEVRLTTDPDFQSQRDEQGGQFGLRIVGGKKTIGGTLCAFIASITSGSPASKAQLEEGDLVLKWNDNMLIGLTYEECQASLDSSQTVSLLVSNFLRGSYRRYRPRSANNTMNGSVESILRGTTHKWIALTRRGVQQRQEVGPDPIQETGEETEQEGARLKVEMRLVYVAMENRLSIHLIQAANIPYREGVDGLDLFCKLYLQPDQSSDSKKRSKTALRTYNPYWNQHFEYQPVSELSLQDRKLEVSLLAYHWLQKHQLMGQIEIDLRDRTVLSGQASWFYLQAPPSESPRTSVSEKKDSLQEEDGFLGSKSLSEMVKERVTIQHRLSNFSTFSTFDSKRELVADVRRSVSDTTKPNKPPKPKTKPQNTGDEDSSDNVFTAHEVIQTHLSNIKESDEQRPPIHVRGSPRRRPKVIRNKSSATKPDPHKYRSDVTSKTRDVTMTTRDVTSSRRQDCTAILREASPTLPITPTADRSLHKQGLLTESSNCRRACRSNSEDFTATKHRILPKTPDVAKKDMSMTLPSKKMISPLLTAQSFATTRVILTAPSSEEYSSPESPKSSIRPNPEGQVVSSVDPHSLLGPGQVSVPYELRATTPGTIVLTLGIDKHMLTIEIVQANNLPMRPSGLAPDTYIKTYILLEQHKSHKEKTTTVRCNANPVFNERITYIVNPTNKILQVMVWDEVGTLRRNLFLGEVLLDLNYIASKGPLQGRYKLYPSYSPRPP